VTAPAGPPAPEAVPAGPSAPEAVPVSAKAGAGPARAAWPAPSARRQYLVALAVGAVGAGLILLAIRAQWAQAVFVPPKPFAQQVIDVSGGDLVPAAGGFGIAALACLAAVIATRGLARRLTGALLALFGVGAAIAVGTSVSAASVLSVAASKVGSPGAAADSGTAGSTTSGSTGGSNVVSLVGTTGHAIMTGTPWRLAVLAGALLLLAAGIATIWRGPRWPVMSARYDLHADQHTGQTADQHAGQPAGQRVQPRAGQPAEVHVGQNAERGASPAGRVPAKPRDSASMWESLSAGADPTDAA